MFQLMFAVITPALISGAVADRLKFWSWTLFVALWVTIVYFPVAHWVFSFDGFVSETAVGGWIANANKLGALDFAGGTAVHINAGAAGLALAIVLGKRRGWPKEPMRPHNVPHVLLGASLLWFGWFGFNAGSALTAGDLAGVAFTNTMLATCTAVLGWLVVEQIRDGKPTTLGAASGAVAGLVAITPAAGYVSLLGGVIIGFVAGAVCALAVALKFRFRFDDSLDVVGVHLVGGLVGTLMVGLFGSTAVNSLSRRRPVLRRRLHAARQAGRGGGRRDGLLVRRRGDPRADHQQDDRLPRQRGGRGHRRRRDRARRVGLRLLDPAAAAGLSHGSRPASRRDAGRGAAGAGKES